MSNQRVASRKLRDRTLQIMRRYAAAAALIIVATLGLTACTVPIKGRTGITVDADGNLMAVFAWCGDNPPNGATIYTSGGFNGKTVATYRAPRLSGGLASVRLDAPADGWVAERPMPVLNPSTTYTVYGWTTNNSGSTSSVEFHASDRNRLAPGTVLIQAYNEAHESADALVSTADFLQRTQALC